MDGKRLLIVVDYQNDFVSGSLGFSGAEKLEPLIEQKIKTCIENGDDLIFTFDTHEENYLETQEGHKLPISHCIKGSEGIKLYGTINKYKERGLCFHKNTFGSSELFNHLQGKDYSEIELVGLVSNICVIANAVLCKTALPECEIIVDALCTASFDPSLNEKTLDVMQGLQITVINR